MKTLNVAITLIKELLIPMAKKLILVILVVVIGIFNYMTPTFEDHQAVLFAKLEQGGVIPENLRDQIIRTVDYSNFFVCSAVKTAEGSRLVTVGILSKVDLKNDRWVSEIRSKFRYQLQQE
jgi:hypothetical protein